LGTQQHWLLPINNIRFFGARPSLAAARLERTAQYAADSIFSLISAKVIDRLKELFTVIGVVSYHEYHYYHTAQIVRVLR